MGRHGWSRWLDTGKTLWAQDSHLGGPDSRAIRNRSEHGRYGMSLDPARLETARDLIAQFDAQLAAHPLPISMLDQIGAASGDAERATRSLAAAAQAVDPDRGWTLTENVAFSPEIRVRATAALMSVSACIHVRRSPAQPIFVNLRTRRADCGRCCRTVRRPVVGADICEWCGSAGVEVFAPQCLKLGVHVIAGDACEDCAEALTVGVGR